MLSGNVDIFGFFCGKLSSDLVTANCVPILFFLDVILLSFLLFFLFRFFLLYLPRFPFFVPMCPARIQMRTPWLDQHRFDPMIIFVIFFLACIFCSRTIQLMFFQHCVRACACVFWVSSDTQMNKANRKSRFRSSALRPNIVILSRAIESLRACFVWCV